MRIYLLAGGQHGPAAFPPRRSIGQQMNNPLDYRWAMRALLVAMNRWIKDGVAPPPSRYPRIADNTLVAPDKLKFPKLAGVGQPTEAHKAYRADYGPDFATKGIVSVEPPKSDSAFPILVPQVDADGNELAGVRMPELAVPLATYTGWNLFNDRSGPTVAALQHAGLVHSAAPHARRSRAHQRSAAVDRRALSRAANGYLALVTAAAQDLVQQRYLLEDDVDNVVKRADEHWSLLFANGETSTR